MEILECSSYVFPFSEYIKSKFTEEVLQILKAAREYKTLKHFSATISEVEWFEIRYSSSMSWMNYENHVTLKLYKSLSSYNFSP